MGEETFGRMMMHQPPIVPRLNLGNQENVMTERVTMGGPSPRMVEKVTMDLGSSKATTVGIVARRKKALEASGVQNKKSSDVLGFTSANEKESTRQLKDLKKQLAAEQALRQEAQEEAATERKARSRAEKEALAERTGKPANLKAMRDDLFDRVQRSSAAMRHNSARKKENREAREKLTPRSPRTPRTATARDTYGTPCSPSVGREERGARTPGFATSRSVARGKSQAMRAPWSMSQARKQQESVSLCTWTQAHSEIARSRSIRLGIQKKPENAALPLNSGMPTCSYFKKHGFCNAFETRGRCAFSHVKQ